MFEKGKSGNPTGRPPGAKDKAKEEIRDMYRQAIENNLPNVETWVKIIADEYPAKALELMLKLSEFCLPKLKSIEIRETDDNRPFIIFQDISGKVIETIA